MKLKHILFFVLFAYVPLFAIEIEVKDSSGKPLDLVMVTVKAEKPQVPPRDDHGYPPEGLEFTITPEVTMFTNPNGRINLPFPYAPSVIVRLRKIGYKDQNLRTFSSNSFQSFRMEKVVDINLLVSQYPSNSWVAALDFGEDKDLRKTYLEQCGFCHQQGSFFMRRAFTAGDWEEIINRMMGYGARPHGKAKKKLPTLLSNAYIDLLKHPERVQPGRAWGKELHGAVIREWPMGDSFSQMHDLLYHKKTGLVYVGDNIQDRLWEINPNTGKTVVYKVPKQPDDELGGLLPGRLRSFQKHETYVGLHSLAESPVDGHIFITPSLQKRITEFDPITKKFTDHMFDDGLYPHTVRIDDQDRVWFTLALSNQIGMFDRKSNKFKNYTLPARTKKESFSLWISGFIVKLMNWGFPMHLLPVDERVSGMPLPYGIDIAPNGNVWFTRLHADTIGVINPKDDSFQLIETPFQGPRRLRIDKDNHIWISAFPEGSIAKYTPEDGKFKLYPLPTAIDGVETPYSLNVDRPRNIVWVNGTSSDNLMAMDIKTEEWKVYPMSRKVTFTRDVEFGPDGKAYTCNGAFPSWQIEDGQPTLMEIKQSK
ncbi:lyase [Leptospira bourretii]|uniref:Vgb family protein n=1 Tax=Leptospira bourretii TaxID=2484962 RepID=UPI001090B46D|nr:lyase [Leptospira bourretii]TGL22883.1 lyase [Leptospira bourretii]